jgi:hypothetical protein
MFLSIPFVVSDARESSPPSLPSHHERSNEKVSESESPAMMPEIPLLDGPET